MSDLGEKTKKTQATPDNVWEKKQDPSVDRSKATVSIHVLNHIIILGVFGLGTVILLSVLF